MNGGSVVHCSTSQETTTFAQKAQNEKAKGWEGCDVQWDELALCDFVRNHYFCLWQYNDDKRRESSCIENSCNSIILEFANGNPTLKKMERWLHNQNFNYFLFTENDHQQGRIHKDKFRVWIPVPHLEMDIDNNNLKKIKAYFLSVWPTANTTAFDKDRMFALAQALIYKFEDKKPFFTPLIIPYLEAEEEGWELSIDTVLTLIDGTQKTLGEITDYALCKCPYPNHFEDNSFAVATIDKTGICYLTCDICKRKWRAEDSYRIQRSDYTVFVEHKTDSICLITNDSNEIEDSIKFFHSQKIGWLNWCHNILSMGKEAAADMLNTLPRAALIFNPALPKGFIRPNQTRKSLVYNTFEESDYLRVPLGTKPKRIILDKHCPTIWKILCNVFGDEKLIELHLNWHAFILQKREKPKTAWLITSQAQGVGKDLLAEKVWKPLYGEKHVSVRFGSEIENRFNQNDLAAWLVVYNELFTGETRGVNEKRKDSMKFRITAPFISIEPKGVDSFQIKNNISYILHSNSEHSLLIEPTDRRYFVVRNPNAEPLALLHWYQSDTELERLIYGELDYFALYIRTIEVNENDANRPIHTLAKRDLIERSTEAADRIADAIKLRKPENLELSVFLEDEGIIAQIEFDINARGVIPSNAMTLICKYYFGENKINEGKKALRKRSIRQKLVKTADGLRVRVWYYHNVFKLKQTNFVDDFPKPD